MKPEQKHREPWNSDAREALTTLFLKLMPTEGN
jgi:hypothetical protein